MEENNNNLPVVGEERISAVYGLKKAIVSLVLASISMVCAIIALSTSFLAMLDALIALPIVFVAICWGTGIPAIILGRKAINMARYATRHGARPIAPRICSMIGFVCGIVAVAMGAIAFFIAIIFGTVLYEG